MVSGGGLFGGVGGHVVEALGAEGHLGAVAGNHCGAKLGFGYMADDFHAFDFADGVVLVERYGEKKFVILASVGTKASQFTKCINSTYLA